VLLESVSTDVGETCAVTWLGISTEAEVVTVTTQAVRISILKTQAGDVYLHGVGHEAGAVMVTGMLKLIFLIVVVVEAVEVVA
jgi:hypothetical protein